MDVERIEEMRLTPVDEAQIASLLVRAFGEDFGGRSFYQQRHHLRLIVRQPTRIVGHMAICYRAIRMGNSLVTIAGLAEVATDPEVQGQGIASALMTAAIDEARASNADFFLLCGTRPIYAGRGFVSAPNAVTHLALHEARTGKVERDTQSHLMVLPIRDMAWDNSAAIDLLGHKF